MQDRKIALGQKTEDCRLTAPADDPVLLFLALFFPASEIGKQILLTLSEGSYDWWYFPFQLCSLPIYLLPLYLILRRKNAVPSFTDSLGAFLIDFSFLGGFFAFFDRSGMHYELPILTVHSYLWHICMILLSIRLIRSSCVDLRTVPYRYPAFLFLITAGIAELLNLCLHPFGLINLFYISPYYLLHQVVFSKVTDAFGNAAGIASYLFAILLGGYLIHRIAGTFAKTNR